MTEREILLKKISTCQFAALDLRLFLDTHSSDSKTLEKMEKYRLEAQSLIGEYEKKYGPLTKNADSQGSWSWTKGPWPWESEDEQ